ncbi:3',5'-cyclic-nucleotide phosphodiesterase [Termitomyces sp. T112]|nr:3',5'-cyclic-nucleotide phosphodiesterase [Termitomyces sp. T112]
MARQAVDWTLKLSNHWDILGPFPIHAREQHHLSPSFPLSLSEPIDWQKAWPSSYADHGDVSWSTDEWKTLRATEGWAALQHHAVLRTTLTIYPPSSLGNAQAPHLLVNLIHGSFFTILPSDPGERRFFVPQWYAGNIYDMERALPRAVELPTPPNLRKPTVYEIFISADYEIRLFGDPAAKGEEIPIQTIRLDIQLEAQNELLVHEPSLDVVCDFVDGKAFGNAFGIALRSISGWWVVKSALIRNTKAVVLTIKRDTVIAPTQTRIVPFSLSQSDVFRLPNIDAELEVISRDGLHKKIITVILPVHHQCPWNQTSYQPIKATYFYALEMPTAFLVVPPVLQSFDKKSPPILALHGAGVDIFEQSFWTQSIPRNKRSWLVFPSGRTSWGLDWHGPSAQDAWATIDSLFEILQANTDWKHWEIDSNARVVLVGHSNGGQGAWYLASRYPDRVVGVIPAAAYIKSQAYIPWTMSRSAHYTDPALRAILDSSLTPDDNDLHLSNLVDIPVLAVHGGNDTNVPVWHSREYVSILKTLGAKNASIREVPNEDHWFSSVFDNEQVQGFLETLLVTEPRSPRSPKDFTLTVSDPRASGTLHGWKVESLIFPGRLALLRVKIDEAGSAQVIVSNVHSFSLDRCLSVCKSVQIGASLIPISSERSGIIRFNPDGAGWTIADPVKGPQEKHPPARLQSILSSNGPISFIISNDTNSRELSIALRLAHDLQIFHRLDSGILRESEVQVHLQDGRLPSGNLVFIGKQSSAFPRTLLSEKRTPFEIKGNVLELNGQVLDDPNTGSIFLHPHPDRKDLDGLVLFVLSNNHESLERLARLFPIRTGVVAPSWIVTSSLSNRIGTGGIRGTGLWSQSWGWNDASSTWIW